MFRSCAAVEKEAVFGSTHILYSKFDDARGVLDDMVAGLAERANTDDIVFTISHEKNWRRNIFKEYKANRKDSRKPMCYYELQAYAEDTWPSLKFTGLEADDIMGIYANRPDSIIWSLDKDLMQCEGHHLIDDDIVYVTPEEGARFHMYQTLVGDVTDNYKGCPGVGDGSAEAFLDEPFEYVETTSVLKSGPNKGQERTTWTKKPTDDVWAGVLSHYIKAGLTEAEALVQARVARILHDGEYDFDKEQVKLWKPNQ